MTTSPESKPGVSMPNVATGDVSIPEVAISAEHLVRTLWHIYRGQ